MSENPLGRRVPSDWEHVDKYPLRSLAATVPVPAVAEKLWTPPSRLVKVYIQPDGSCVGFSESWLMSILNGRGYKAHWLYEQAQAIDEYPDTPPAEGTSVRAGFDVLRTVGHVRRHGNDTPYPVSLDEGIISNHWATTIDEVRAGLLKGPGVIGINWYSNFENPVKVGNEYWIGRTSTLGSILGGHAICACGVSDRRHAIRLVNTWGPDYPRVWLPYSTLERLMGEQGEVGFVTDRPTK